jgi:hypothetical protein
MNSNKYNGMFRNATAPGLIVCQETNYPEERFKFL